MKRSKQMRSRTSSQNNTQNATQAAKTIHKLPHKQPKQHTNCHTSAPERWGHKVVHSRTKTSKIVTECSWKLAHQIARLIAHPIAFSPNCLLSKLTKLLPISFCCNHLFAHLHARLLVHTLVCLLICSLIYMVVFSFPQSCKRKWR